MIEVLCSWEIVADSQWAEEMNDIAKQVPVYNSKNGP